MRCCASYRISFHLYQSGLLGRVPQPVPRGNSLSQQVGGARGCGGQHASFRRPGTCLDDGAGQAHDLHIEQTSATPQPQRRGGVSPASPPRPALRTSRPQRASHRSSTALRHSFETASGSSPGRDDWEIDFVSDLWPLDGSRMPVTSRGHTGEIDSIAFSPEGTRLVTSADSDEVARYNRERSHSALGPGLRTNRLATLTGHGVSAAHCVVASARLGGLHLHCDSERLAA